MSKASVIALQPVDENTAVREARTQVIKQVAAEQNIRPKRVKTSRPAQRSWWTAPPASLWGPMRAVGLTHRLSSKVARAAYPFLSGGALGIQGVPIGQLVDGGGLFAFDAFEAYEAGLITNPSALFLGSIGQGKSALVKHYALLSLALGHRFCVASDPKGEWVLPAETVGGQVIGLRLNGQMRINPLDAPPRNPEHSDAEHMRAVASHRRNILLSVLTELLGRPVLPAEYTALDVALDDVVARHSTPTLVHVYDALLSPAQVSRDLVQDSGAELAHILRRVVRGDLSGMFDGPSTVSFDKDAPCVVMDTSGFAAAGEQATNIATLLAADWISAAVRLPGAGRRNVIYDEGYRMLRNKEQLLRMSDDWKLARALGMGNILVMHRLSDLDAIGDVGSAARELALGLLRDTQVHVIGKQEASDIDQAAELLRLTDTVASEIGRLPRGHFIWNVNGHPYQVRTVLTADESERVFNTDERMNVDHSVSGICRACGDELRLGVHQKFCTKCGTPTNVRG